MDTIYAEKGTLTLTEMAKSVGIHMDNRKDIDHPSKSRNAPNSALNHDTYTSNRRRKTLSKRDVRAAQHAATHRDAFVSLDREVLPNPRLKHRERERVRMSKSNIKTKVAYRRPKTRFAGVRIGEASNPGPGPTKENGKGARRTPPKQSQKATHRAANDNRKDKGRRIEVKNQPNSHKPRGMPPTSSTAKMLSPSLDLPAWQIAISADHPPSPTGTDNIHFHRESVREEKMSGATLRMHIKQEKEKKKNGAGNVIVCLCRIRSPPEARDPECAAKGDCYCPKLHLADVAIIMREEAITKKREEIQDDLERTQKELDEADLCPPTTPVEQPTHLGGTVNDEKTFNQESKYSLESSVSGSGTESDFDDATTVDYATDPSDSEESNAASDEMKHDTDTNTPETSCSHNVHDYDSGMSWRGYLDTGANSEISLSSLPSIQTYGPKPVKAKTPAAPPVPPPSTALIATAPPLPIAQPVVAAPIIGPIIPLADPLAPWTINATTQHTATKLQLPALEAIMYVDQLTRDKAKETLLGSITSKLINAISTEATPKNDTAIATRNTRITNKDRTIFWKWKWRSRRGRGRDNTELYHGAEVRPIFARLYYELCDKKEINAAPAIDRKVVSRNILQTVGLYARQHPDIDTYMGLCCMHEGVLVRGTDIIENTIDFIATMRYIRDTARIRLHGTTTGVP